MTSSSHRNARSAASAFVALQMVDGYHNSVVASNSAHFPIPFRMISHESSGRGFAKEQKKELTSGKWQPIDVPLVFVPGMKGTHLSFQGEARSTNSKRKRVWLTLSHLLNIPPLPDGHPTRDLSLPLTYDEPNEEAMERYEDGSCLGIASRYPKQHIGNLVPDGIVDHIIEFNIGSSDKTSSEPCNFVDLNFLPFYGHTTRLLREMDRRYHKRILDGKVESTDSFKAQDDIGKDESKKGIFDRMGYFIERTSNWAFANSTMSSAEEQQSHHPSKHCRPTAVFTYDWRRSLPELCADLHEFCETTFPDQPVQVLAHSLGGLMTFAAMRSHPEKYVGAVVAGVPFETGIQYLQDLHRGYYTELDRCRQFTPEVQFTMSSHWPFFPISKTRLEDRFVDVSDKFTNGTPGIKFDADVSSIGKPINTIQPKVDGKNAYFDFYDPDEWERAQLGIFGPEYDDKLNDNQRKAYKYHMRIQMAAAKEWRKQVLGEDELTEKQVETADDSSKPDLPKIINFPSFVACASDTIPTVNQILRRKRQSSTTENGRRKGALNMWEYDYINGRSVPGDGRIDYDKAFPPMIEHKRVTLDSAHAKQMCWEESGGSLARVYQEVVEQITDYLDRPSIDPHRETSSCMQVESSNGLSNRSNRNRKKRRRNDVKQSINIQGRSARVNMWQTRFRRKTRELKEHR